MKLLGNVDANRVDRSRPHERCNPVALLQNLLEPLDAVLGSCGAVDGGGNN
jgi:hypothetical protein